MAGGPLSGSLAIYLLGRSPAGALLLHEVRGGAIIAAWVGAFFAAAEIARRLAGVRAEHTRKLTHVGAGAVIFFTPWLLSSVWSVGLLCGGFALILGLSDRLGLLRSVHGVERRTFGALLYPVSVFVTYVLAAGDGLLFQIAILVLALSDTVAALVGQQAGSVRYRVGDGTRSLEGSAAFLTLTFLLVLLALVVGGRAAWPDMLLLVLVVSLVATAVESISVLGLDNLLVPAAVVFMLRRTLPLPLPELGNGVMGMVMVLALILATAWRVRLAATGFVLLSLVGYLAWVLAGPAWLLPLAALYLGWVATRRPDRLPPAAVGVGVEAVFPMVAVSTAILLLYAQTGWPWLYGPFLASAGANGVLRFTAPVRVRLVGSAAAGAAGLLPVIAGAA